MDMMIPDAANVPAYASNPELARKSNEDAAAGISTGFPARLKMSGKQFVLVDGNGDEKLFPLDKLIAGPDGNAYLPALFLRAKKSLNKAWYAGAYDPNSEGVAPDCFSLDGEHPDATSTGKQSDVCAACPQNAWGSGTDQNGNATKGKACSDTKILAAFLPGFGIHQVNVRAASLKNFGLYVKQLSGAGIALGVVKSFISFDPTQTYPVMIFRYGGFIGEALLPKLAELSESQETLDIIFPKSTAVVAPAEAVTSAMDPALPQAEAELIMHDSDLGLGNIKPATTAATPVKATPVKATPVTAPTGPTDEELRAQLGL